MYTHFFRFSEPPFAITPDPAFLYLSPRHHEALAHLLYGTGDSGGFVQLTGEVGTGKTTVIRTLLEQKLPEVDVALILNPRQSTEEFLQSICDELGVSYPEGASLKALVDHLNRHLLATHSNGRRTVLIIDEAQNLSEDLLEQVRLLTNLETSKEKLLRIMLIGQPELDDLLARPSLRQLAQRITARFHLTALDRHETAEYIAHRLRVAGGDASIFEPAAIRAVYRCSGGIPRLINIICDRALLAAYSAGTRSVSASMVREAARSTSPGNHAPSRLSWRLGWIPGIALAGMLLAAWLLQSLLPMVEERSEAAKGTAVASSDDRPAPEPPPPVEHAFVWANSPTARAPTEAASRKPSAPATSTEPSPPPNNQKEASISADQFIARTPSLGTQVELLLGLWDASIRVPSGEPVCRAIQSKALRCLRGEADWADLLRFDRPAILTLVTASGRRTYVLMRGVTETHALVVLDGELRRVERSLIDLLWNGEFLLFWRGKQDVDVLRPGDSGPQIQWLRQALAAAAGEPLIGAPDSDFDGALRERVEAFQRQHGLKVDGHVGEHTHLMLMQQLRPEDGPRLLTESS